MAEEIKKSAVPEPVRPQEAPASSLADIYDQLDIEALQRHREFLSKRVANLETQVEAGTDDSTKELKMIHLEYEQYDLAEVDRAIARKSGQESVSSEGGIEKEASPAEKEPGALEVMAGDLEQRTGELASAVDKARTVKGEGEPDPWRRVLEETSDPANRGPEGQMNHAEVVEDVVEKIEDKVKDLTSIPGLDAEEKKAAEDYEAEVAQVSDRVDSLSQQLDTFSPEAKELSANEKSYPKKDEEKSGKEKNDFGDAGITVAFKNSESIQ